MAKFSGAKFASVSRQEPSKRGQSIGVSLDKQDALLNERRRDTALRNLLLGSVAAGVAIFGYGRAAYAACTTVGTTMTCTGDLSGGVVASNPVTVLNVNSLTEDIRPPVNGGINFTSDGAITIVSDTGDSEIIVTGFAPGIRASTSGAAAVSVTHTGDITSITNQGINARSLGGAITTVSIGDIQADDAGIYAYTLGAAAVSISHTGDITSDTDRGISALSTNGAVTTFSTGDIQADDTGIRALTTGAADVSVTHTGDITSDDDQGINARSSGGAVTTVSIGDIQADNDGIYASTTGTAAVSVTHTGDITSDTHRGIYAFSSSGAVTTVSSGDIQADDAGIRAFTNGAADVSVTHTGDITSDTHRGIHASSSGGAITTVSIGDIQADDAGIHAFTSGAADVSVTHTGDITSDTEWGIYAYSDGGAITKVSVGDIQANYAGIRAYTTGAGAVSVTHTGDITSDTEQGIYAYSRDGAVTTVSSGDIQANTAGIHASTDGADAVSVTHTGDITSDTEQGIYAFSRDGAVTTVSSGDIQAGTVGIHASTDVASAVSVTHTGDITSDAEQGIDARSNGGVVTTVSIGDIQANTEGIRARTFGAAAVSVTHTGDITSDTDRGIYARSSGGAVTTVSTGDIQADDAGIRAVASGAVSVTHTGDITSDTDRGIYARSFGGAITTVSIGDIQASTEGIRAFTYSANAVSVTHTGDITSDNNRGINAYSSGGSVAITLGEGVVQGAFGAIETSSGTGTAFTLNAGSVLIGSVTFGGAGASVLNTGPGLSIAHTFTGTVPTIGNVSGNVAVVSGNQIAVADISGLAFADNQLSATLDGVSGVLAMASHHETGNWWISGFGGGAVASADGNSAETTPKYGGLVAGTFALLDNGVQLGVFAGAASGDHTTDISNGLSGNSTSYFAGVHGRFIRNLFSVDFAVTAGGSSHEGERIVANNTVATGLESASSSFDSFFIAPEITLSTAPINILDFSFMPSVRIRYEAMRSDGFAETGLTSGAISTDGATSHAVNMRLQGAVPIDLGVSGTTLVARGGVDARFASFSGNDVTLMGVVTNDAGADVEFSTRGFAGLDFSHSLSDHTALTANGEVRAGTTGYSATASLGLMGKF